MTGWYIFDFVVSFRKLASFTLYMSDYFNPIIGNIGRILKSHSVMSTMCAQHWVVAVELDQYSKEEIIFWRKIESSVKSWHCFLTKTPQIFAYSDTMRHGVWIGRFSRQRASLPSALGSEQNFQEFNLKRISGNRFCCRMIRSHFRRYSCEIVHRQPSGRKDSWDSSGVVDLWMLFVGTF